MELCRRVWPGLASWAKSGFFVTKGGIERFLFTVESRRQEIPNIRRATGLAFKWNRFTNRIIFDWGGTSLGYGSKARAWKYYYNKNRSSHWLMLENIFKDFYEYKPD